MLQASFYCQNEFEMSFIVVHDCMYEHTPIIIAAVPVLCGYMSVCVWKGTDKQLC